MIAAVLDRDFSGARERVRWMPSYKAAHAIGTMRDSTGHPITPVMWRANRLADALAKAAAGKVRLPDWATRWAQGAASLVRHTAALLGVTTHTANNYVLTEVGPDGEPVARVLRDSTAAPGRAAFGPRAAGTRRKYGEAFAEPGPVPVPLSLLAVPQAGTAQARRPRGRGGHRATPTAASQARVRAAAAQASSLRQEVEREAQLARHLASVVLVPPVGPSGSDRQAACRARVRARMREAAEGQ